MLGESIDFGPDFWSKDRRRSGREIDVLRGQNIPANSKSIDRTRGMSTVISHKSTDLRCRSYQSPRAVHRLGMSFVRTLAAYAGETRCDHKIKATYHLHWALEAPDAQRILEWLVPQSGVSIEQEDALAGVVAAARSHGVTVKVFRVSGGDDV